KMGTNETLSPCHEKAFVLNIHRERKEETRREELKHRGSKGNERYRVHTSGHRSEMSKPQSAAGRRNVLKCPPFVTSLFKNQRAEIVPCAFRIPQPHA